MSVQDSRLSLFAARCSSPTFGCRVTPSVSDWLSGRAAAQARLHLHVNTQGTLSPEDWDNEGHANRTGWPKLAQAIFADLLPWLDKIAAAKAAALNTLAAGGGSENSGAQAAGQATSAPPV